MFQSTLLRIGAVGRGRYLSSHYRAFSYVSEHKSYQETVPTPSKHGLLHRPPLHTSLFRRLTSSAALEASKSVTFANELSRSPFHKKALQEGFVTIYFFPYIKFAYLFCRAKIYQTAAVTLAIPVQMVLFPEMINTTDFYISVGGASFSAFVLICMGEFFRRFVGFIYYHPEREVVRIAHMNFFGRRTDIEYPVEDIVPLSDIEKKLDDVYVHVKTYAEPKGTYYMNLKFGKITHKDHFETVFGTVHF